MKPEEFGAIKELLPLNTTEFLILLTLRDGDCHGYRLVKEIERRSRGAVSLMPGNLYAVLRRMQRQGVIAQADGPDDPNQDGRRRYYRITDVGQQTAAAEAARLKDLVRAAEASALIGETST